MTTIHPNRTECPRSSPASPEIAQQFREFVLEKGYPCLGAKSAFRNSDYYVGQYETLGTLASAQGMVSDLLTFIKDRATMAGDFATFVAVFDDPASTSEEHFESLLWQQLTALHQLDDHPWASSAARDPASPDFGFSFGGVAFFIIGLHARSARLARQFSRPALVFNAHSQFDLLRETGKYQKMQQVIRTRDIAKQGSANPMLADFGTSSEARQYSGRAVSSDWQCPFHPQKTSQ